MSKSALEKAVETVGGQTEFGRRLGVAQGQVWAWLHRNKSPFPAEFCIAVEEATESKVTRYELRPDVFGPAPKAQQKAAA